MELTINEKRVLAALADLNSCTDKELAEKLNTTPESAVQWAHLCADRGLLVVEKRISLSAKLTEEGKKYAEEGGLPERQIINKLKELKELLTVIH